MAHEQVADEKRAANAIKAATASDEDGECFAVQT